MPPAGLTRRPRTAQVQPKYRFPLRHKETRGFKNVETLLTAGQSVQKHNERPIPRPVQHALKKIAGTIIGIEEQSLGGPRGQVSATRTQIIPQRLQVTANPGEPGPE